MAEPTLSLGITSTDRTRAIIDGRIAVPGVSLDVRIDEPQRLFRAAQRDAALDMAELSLGTHLLQVAGGRARYHALPVFLSRAFRHNAVHVRADRGIDRPSDLNGRRIGIQGFQQTATIWVRGILAEQYGFDPASARWVVGGLDRPGDLERSPLDRPPALPFEPAGEGETLDGLLRAGAIDAVIAPLPPPCAGEAGVPVRPLFADAEAEERAFHARTGLFPVMHVLGLRKDVAEAHPGLAAALFAAFAAAKSLAQAELLRGNYLRASLPWLAAEARRTRRLMGPNPWSYGFAANRHEIEALIRHAVRDGLIAPGLAPEALFHPDTLALTDPDAA